MSCCLKKEIEVDKIFTFFQNGFDNSGRRGAIRWLQGDNVDRTINILGKVAALLETW